MLKVSDREQQLNVRFNMIAGSVGMRHTRWARLTIILFGLWTLGTSFLCFQKPDFLNLTVGICGLFILLDPQMLKASYLRLLVAVIPVTQLYDLMWLLHKSGEYWDNKTEGGMTQLILVVAYMMVVFKIILFFIMWKASLNFQKFVQQQRELVGLK